MAIALGRRSRATLVGDKPGERAPASAASAVTLVGSESGLVGLVVEELRHALVAALLGIEETRLVDLGKEVILGVIPRHVEHAAIGVLGGFHRDRVLLHQHL